MINEDFVVEVAEWLEKAAHDTNLERVARRMLERKAAFLKFNISLHFVGREMKGIEYAVEHSVQDFQAAIGMTNEEMRLLRDFVATNGDPNIRIRFEATEGSGESLYLSVIKSIPRGTKDTEIQGVTDDLLKILSLAKEAGVTGTISIGAPEEEGEKR